LFGVALAIGLSAPHKNDKKLKAERLALGQWWNGNPLDE
jgi:hypothetical protein